MNSSSRPTAVVLHIPKTAGTSFRHAALDNYSAPEIFLHYPKSSGPGHSTLEHYWEADLARISGYRLLMGHFTIAAARYAPRSAVCVTLLRNPEDQLISHYRHVLRLGPRYRHQEHKPGLAQFLEEHRIPGLDNIQTRFLSGVPVRWGECNEGMLEAAIENLENRIAVAGITERFPESLSLIAHHLGWKNRSVRKLNQAPPKEREPGPGIVSELHEQFLHYDRRLYAHAAKLFDTRLRQLELLPPTTGVLARITAKLQRWMPAPTASGVSGACDFQEWQLSCEGRTLRGQRTPNASETGHERLRIEVFGKDRVLAETDAGADRFTLELPPGRAREARHLVTRHADQTVIAVQAIPNGDDSPRSETI